MQWECPGWPVSDDESSINPRTPHPTETISNITTPTKGMETTEGLGKAFTRKKKLHF